MTSKISSLMDNKEHSDSTGKPVISNKNESLRTEVDQNIINSPENQKTNGDISNNNSKEVKKTLTAEASNPDANKDTVHDDNQNKVNQKQSKTAGNFPCYMCDNSFDDIQEMMAHLVDDHQIAP